MVNISITAVEMLVGGGDIWNGYALLFLKKEEPMSKEFPSNALIFDIDIKLETTSLDSVVHIC